MRNSDPGTTHMRVGRDDGELRPCHYIYIYSIESRLIRRIMYESKSSWIGPSGNSNAQPQSSMVPRRVLFSRRI